MAKIPEFIDSNHPYCIQPIFARGIYSNPDKGVKRGQLVYGSPVLDAYNNQTYICYFSKDGQLSHLPIAPRTLSYFTGFYDRNHHRIFQGDIVELLLPIGEIRRFEVVFCTQKRNLQPLPGFVPGDNWVALHAVGFRWRNSTLFPSVSEDGKTIDTQRMLVIGNIFESPGLLDNDGSDLPF